MEPLGNKPLPEPMLTQIYVTTSAVCQALCVSTILASDLDQNTSLNPPAHIWGSIKFGVRSLSLALYCLLRSIWHYPVFSLWNGACSPRTLRVWYLATHHGNYTRGVFALVDDNDSIVLVTEPLEAGTWRVRVKCVKNPIFLVNSRGLIYNEETSYALVQCSGNIS